MTQTSTIIFVCEHGAAKSIIAAAYFNKLANEKGLNISAIARGTTPDETLSPKAIQGLLEDGLTPTEATPQELTFTEIRSAKKVVTFCNISNEEYHQAIAIEQWEGVPPVSENYHLARNAILEKLNSLITVLQNE